LGIGGFCREWTSRASKYAPSKSGLGRSTTGGHGCPTSKL